MISDKIKIALTESIDSGEFAPGSKLPSRHQLMKRYRVARATIDKVLREMTEAGLVHSVQGGGTYVSGIYEKRLRHIYMITPSDGWAASSHADAFKEILENMHHQCPATIVSFGDMERRFLRARSQDARLIWDCPGLHYYSLIDSYHMAKTHQIVINRPHPRYNYAATDTRRGIEKMLKAVGDRQAERRVGVLSIRPLPDRPFLTEREIYFYELAVEMGFHIERVVRSTHFDSSSQADAVYEYFSGPKPPPLLFVPEISFQPHLLMMARERKMELGKNLTLMFTDKADSNPGVFSLQQNMKEMYREALQWATANTVSPLQRLVDPILHLPIEKS